MSILLLLYDLIGLFEPSAAIVALIMTSVLPFLYDFIGFCKPSAVIVSK